MEAILLKAKKDHSVSHTELCVFDELIQGVLQGTFFVPVFTGAHGGLSVSPVSYLIENYRFPEKEGHSKVRFAHFIRGNNPSLFEKIEWYEVESIDLSETE